MTLKMAVHFHNPRANPSWLDDDAYHFWRSEVDGDPEPGSVELDAAEAAFDEAVANGAVGLSATALSIVGDGVDSTDITVTMRLPFPDYVILNISGTDVQIDLSPKEIGAPFTRVAYIDNLTSDTPGQDIVIEPVMGFNSAVPGGEPLVIEVT